MRNAKQTNPMRSEDKKKMYRERGSESHFTELGQEFINIKYIYDNYLPF